MKTPLDCIMERENNPQMIGEYVSLKTRMSAGDAHYAGELVEGAHIVTAWGDVGTELAIRLFGDESLFVGYSEVRYTAPVFAGDWMEYGGYIEKQNEHIRRFENQENMLLPPDFDYESINGLRLEARQKLTAMRPVNLGQASRISGVSPADIAVLMIKLKQNGQNTAYSENETVTEDKKI